MTIPESALPALVVSKPVIPIVSAFDNNFAPIFSVFLESLISTLSKDYFYDLVILSDAISNENKKTIQFQTARQENLGIRYFEMSDSLPGKMPLHEKHFSKSTFFRLKLSSILPGYEKVIYIDPDTIVIKDLKEIYKENLVDNYAAVVRCFNTMEHRLAGLFAGKPYSHLTFQDYLLNEVEISKEDLNNYFNAGVMVLNLKKMREDKIEAQLLSLFYSKNYFLVDQDILNKAFDCKVLFLPFKWNVIHLDTNRQIAQLPPAHYLEYCQGVEDPAIIHYAAPFNKPWLNKAPPFCEIFWVYARRSPHYEYLFIKYLMCLKELQESKKISKKLIRFVNKLSLKVKGMYEP